MKKGLKRTIGGSLILVLAIIIPIINMTMGFMKLASADTQAFVVPGTAEVHADQVGIYYLWNDYITTHEGVTYHSSLGLPDDMVITVKDPEGMEMEIESSTTISINNMSHAKNSIGFVNVRQPGTYTVSVEGTMKNRVLSWAPFDAEKIVKGFLKGLGFVLIFGLGGLAVCVWGIIALCSNDKKTAVPS